MNGKIGDLEDLKQKMVYDHMKRQGFPEDTPAYLVWGHNPDELIEVLKEFLEREPINPFHHAILKASLPGIRRRGYNVVALFLLKDRLHIHGGRTAILHPLKG